MFSTRAEGRQQEGERGGEGESPAGYAKERASALSCHYIICIISCGAQAGRQEGWEVGSGALTANQ